VSIAKLLFNWQERTWFYFLNKIITLQKQEFYIRFSPRRKIRILSFMDLHINLCETLIENSICKLFSKKKKELAITKIIN
jgi:hypothetical protein